MAFHLKYARTIAFVVIAALVAGVLYVTQQDSDDTRRRDQIASCERLNDQVKTTNEIVKTLHDIAVIVRSTSTNNALAVQLGYRTAGLHEAAVLDCNQIIK